MVQDELHSVEEFERIDREVRERWPTGATAEIADGVAFHESLPDHKRFTVRGTDVRACLGGTCNETVTSTRACAHLALVTHAAQVLAKPGMGFDEGYAVVTNEMQLALKRHGHDPHR